MPWQQERIKMLYVTSDIHGKFDSLKKLLDRADFYSDESNFLFILGDVIDRNEDGGVKILKWLTIQPNVQLLLGNHEHMLLSNAWLFKEVTGKSLDELKYSDLRLLDMWKRNGADPTIQALRKESPETRQAILEYLQDCPLYETVSAGGREFVLVHGGLGNFRVDKPLYEYTADELLWERPEYDERYCPDKFTVILGHTPTGYYSSQFRGHMIKTVGWCDIDTGAAGGGEPMLLRLDDMSEFYLTEE